VSDNFRVRISKDQFVFSAAHFITYGDDICERLHGHNYRVEVELVGELNRHGYVADFIAVRDAVAAIAARLDHRMLLPAHHPLIRVQESANEVEVHFRDRRWLFPQQDCLVLPVTNTTTELLASWIADRLAESLPSLAADGIRLIRVAVDENSGQWGICERELAL
jgi:6-pyruvoyltetrahydropterin/6-carboxytetrahydropterin synthase